jgi:hypothetical protein
MKILVINGYPGSGKDEFVKFCMDNARGCVKQLWTSTPAKKAFIYMLGWDGKKTPEVRKGMAEVMEIANTLFDTSFKHIEKELELIAETAPNSLVFIHVREPQNIERYVKAFAAGSVFIAREEHAEITNPSDANVEDYQYDYVVNNRGTLNDLRNRAYDFMDMLRLKEAR